MDKPRKLGRPPSTVKSKKRSMTFPAGLYQRLEAVAKDEERPVSELIVQAVRELLKEKESGNSETLPLAV